MTCMWFCWRKLSSAPLLSYEASPFAVSKQWNALPRIDRNILWSSSEWEIWGLKGIGDLSSLQSQLCRNAWNAGTSQLHCNQLQWSALPTQEISSPCIFSKNILLLPEKKPFTRIVCTVCYPLNFNIQNFTLNDFEYMEFKIIIECYSYQPIKLGMERIYVLLVSSRTCLMFINKAWVRGDNCSAALSFMAPVLCLEMFGPELLGSLGSRRYKQSLLSDTP